MQIICPRDVQQPCRCYRLATQKWPHRVGSENVPEETTEATYLVLGIWHLVTVHGLAANGYVSGEERKTQRTQRLVAIGVVEVPSRFELLQVPPHQ